MKCPSSELLALYGDMAPAAMFRSLQRQAGKTIRDGIFTARLILWMMIVQRLEGGTLGQVLGQLRNGQFDTVLSRCKRAREHRIGSSTGGYCQARQKLPRSLVVCVVDDVIERLRERLGVSQPGKPRLYVLDGSSIQLECTPDLVQSYAQPQNRHGASHFPVLKVVVAHEAETGIAERPYSGPMYGAHAVSEQALAKLVIRNLPTDAVIIADRNFGVFSTAYDCQQGGIGIIVRLTAARVKRMHPGPICNSVDDPVEWRPSAFERRRHPEFPAEARVTGRLICRQVGRGKKKQWIYLFTTAGAPAARIVEWYGKRWNIETDLRTLKQTIRLGRLTAQSADLVEKELLVAVLAYNFVRAVMCMAAQHRGISPRRLSFTYSCNYALASLGRILSLSHPADRQKEIDRLILTVAESCRLPNRSKRKSPGRAVWSRGYRFPLKKQPQN